MLSSRARRAQSNIMLQNEVTEYEALTQRNTIEARNETVEQQLIQRTIDSPDQKT